MRAPEVRTAAEPAHQRSQLIWPALIAAAMWAGKTALILHHDIRRLVMAPWVQDDAFIFMRVARNLALGHGYSFDGLNPTSGAPPLWIWLTAGNHLLWGPEGAAKATLIESAFFGAAATLMAFAIARRFAGRAVAWLSFALSALLAPAFFNGLNGMETSLFTFVGLVALWLYMDRANGRGTVAGYFLVGCTLGVLNLARADGMFLGLAVVLVEVVYLVRAERSRRAGLIGKIVVLVVGAALFTLPLLLLCLRANGTVIPSNQFGRRLISWERAMRADGSLAWRAVPGRLVYNFLNMQDLLALSMGSAVLAVLSAIAGLLRKGSRRLAAIALVYCLSYFSVLILYQWFFPNLHGLRYLNLPAHILIILVSTFCVRVLAGVTARFRLRRVALGAVTLLILTSSFYGYREVAREFDVAGRARLVPAYSDAEVESRWGTLDWVAGNMPRGTVVAASDHGALAYFTEVSVVDLDGILDPEPIRAVWSGSIADVFARRRVEYVILWPVTAHRRFHQAVRADCELEPVPGSPGGAVYRLRR